MLLARRADDAIRRLRELSVSLCQSEATSEFGPKRHRGAPFGRPSPKRKPGAADRPGTERPYYPSMKKRPQGLVEMVTDSSGFREKVDPMTGPRQFSEEPN